MIERGWLATVGASTNKLENGQTAEANESSKNQHRWRKPGDLPVPAPVEIEGPVANGCNPHNRKKAHEHRENEIHALPLTGHKAFEVHETGIALNRNVRNWGESDRWLLLIQSGKVGQHPLISEARDAAPSPTPGPSA